MKTITTISKVTMLFAFAAFANNLMASGNLKVNIVPVNSEKAVVAISSATTSNLQISIADNENQEVLYHKTETEKNDYQKVFDFSRLKAGDYKLSVTADNMTTERSFSITNESISVGNEKRSIDPFFVYKDGILKISYLNFSEQKLNLNLYSNSELIYEKKMGNEFNVQNGLNLSKLDKGTYSVVLSTDDKSYTYNVNIE
jgi:hypothetical protein